MQNRQHKHHHTDPVEINKDIQLPLKDEKLAKLQESDPTQNS